MNTIVKNGVTISVADRTLRLESVQDILDLIVSASFMAHSAGVVVFRETLPERFFDLKSGLAGDMLQKFSNYNLRLAIVGDFSGYTSKSLKDFIYECNKGRLIFFKPDLEAAADALSSV
ncbi:protein of unknown function [Sporobacter termitidis DSM 10068]|uniref:DUF4180 domain-containing protein n=1 Tax=Sporobacter termitidis DSM 10068 TaxID=1123282 RepID=A0A1M5X343_9FIRM|nr:DUF4180 domain-containing protein [Sporobacter termitidis]SHH94230.1 protein of unknown function [Sporobacter termitidis DSM 10068]